MGSLWPSKVGDGDTKAPLTIIAEAQESERRKSKDFRSWATWPATATLGLIAALCATIFNLVIIIWVSTRPQHNGLATIYTGPWNDAKGIELVSKLIVNVISTTVFLASMRCVQFLCAPTRQDIDAVHQRGSWLDIGMRSLRNFSILRGWRLWLCVCLTLCSMPLHLLYNSTIVLKYVGHNSVAITVNSAFVNGESWNSSIYVLLSSTGQYSSSLIDLATQLQSKAKANALSSFAPHDCVKLFATSYQSNWGNLLVVSEDGDLANNSTGVIAAFTENYVAKSGSPASGWWYKEGNSTSGYIPSIDQDVAAYAQQCIVESTECLPGHISYEPVKVTQCLVENAADDNIVCVSIAFLVLALVLNSILAVLLFLTRSKKDFDPLVTIGDAIASFLSHPDPNSADVGTLSINELTKRERATNVSSSVYHVPEKAHKWFNAAGLSHWCSAISSMLVVVVVPLLACHWSKQNNASNTNGKPEISYDSDNGSNLRSPVIVQLHGSFAGSAIRANLAQLFLTSSYLFVSDLLSTMSLAREYHQYSFTRKPLRTTRPSGQQLTTNWLGIPFTSSAPMIVIWTLIQWMTSLTISAVKLDVYTYQGQIDNVRSSNGVFFNASLMWVIMGFDLVIFCTLLVLGCWRLRPGMPLARTCSLAISAICHKKPGEPQDAAYMPLQFGVLPDTFVGDMQCIGFSSEEVRPVVPGQSYTVFQADDSWMLRQSVIWSLTTYVAEREIENDQGDIELQERA